jgi:hypothetical protein
MCLRGSGPAAVLRVEIIGACRYSAAPEAHILWGLGIRDRAEVSQLAERLRAAGMPTLDISGIEAAQVLPSSLPAALQNPAKPCKTLHAWPPVTCWLQHNPAAVCSARACIAYVWHAQG